MIKLTTNHGDILVELDADKAPVTCANFEQYVRDGFYSSRGSAPAAAMATRTCPSQT
jgi:cyclophilin family peptidyl-prolyl cis-trans isomerase